MTSYRTGASFRPERSDLSPPGEAGTSAPIRVGGAKFGLSCADGKILSWSPAAEALTGHAGSEVIGRSLLALVAPAATPAAARALEALERGGAIVHDTLLRRKDGVLIEVEICLSGDPAGAADAGACGAICDLTEQARERRASEVEAERLKLAMRAADIGAYDIDLATQRYTLDPRAAAIWGRDPAKPVYYDALAAQVLDEDRGPAEAALQASLDPEGDGAYAVEFRIRRLNDSALRWVALQGRTFFACGLPVSRVGVMLDVTERKRVAAALDAAHAEAAQQRAELDAIFEALNLPIMMFSSSGEIMRANAAARAVWGIAGELDGPLDVSRLAATLSVRDSAGEALEPEALSAPRARRGETVTDEKYQIVSAAGLRLDFEAAELPLVVNGEITGAVSVWRDATQQNRREEQTSLLLRELSHRSKNLLTVIESILRQSAKGVGSKDDFVARFSERLRALSNAHDLLARNNSLCVSMTDLIFSQVGHHWEPGQRRISMSGLGLRLKPDAAQMIGMALHELSTNAAKYGALSNLSGRVAISWRIDPEPEEPVFELKWAESGGPPVVPPERKGFGTTVIQRVAGQSLNGRAELDYHPGGVVWILRAPRSSVTDPAYLEASRGERIRSPSLQKLEGAWMELHGEGALPRLADLPLNEPELRDYLIVADVDASSEPPALAFVHVGKALLAQMDRAARLEAAEQNAPGEAKQSRAGILGVDEAAYRRCMRSRRPAYEYAYFNLGEGGAFFFERLLLPLSSDGETIAHVVGLASFDEAAFSL